MKFCVLNVPIALSLLVVACSQSPGGNDEASAGAGGQDDQGQAGGGGGGAGGTVDRIPEGGAGGSGGSPNTGGAGGSPVTGGKGGMAGMASAGGAGGTPAPGTGGSAVMPSQCGSLPICDGFEGFPDGPYANGTLQIDGGQAAHYTISTEQKRAGQKSIKVEVGAAGETKRMLRANLGTKLGNASSVFARAWMFFPQLPKLSRAEGTAHYRLIRSFELIPPNASSVVSAGIVGSDRGRLLYFKPAGFKDCAADGATLPANKWTCVEYRSDSNGFEAWIDGQSIGARSTATGDNCWQKREKVFSVAFGFEIAAGNLDVPLTFYMDDIALDTKRIGCN